MSTSSSINQMATRMARHFGNDTAKAKTNLYNYIGSLGNKMSPGWKASLAGDDTLLLEEMAGMLSPVDQSQSFRRGLGAFTEGALRAFNEKTGYADPRTIKLDPKRTGEAFESMETIDFGGNSPAIVKRHYVPASSLPRRQYANEFWKTSAEGANYNTAESILFRAGALGGDIVGNAMRSNLWNIHPYEVTEKNVGNFVIGDTAKGYPQSEAYLDVDKLASGNAKPVTVKGSAEAALIASLGGFAAVEALAVGSGNYNPMNFQQGGRSDGYSALTAEEGGDQRVPTNVASDVVQRHFFGRKGRVLPWEQFRLERPDVSYEQYNKYRDWQYGKSDNDPLNDLTLGLAKFTGEGLSGTPEFSMMGVSITPLGAAGALGAALGARKINHVLGAKSFDRFADLAKKSKTTPLVKEELAEYHRNPFYVAAYGDDSRGVPGSPIRAAQYQHMIDNNMTRW